jgi:methyltransferase (TIGR00027 family)
VGRAFELTRPPQRRIVDDPYAPVFLTALSRAVLAPLRTAAPIVQLVERVPLAGLSGFGLCRHRFIDEHLRTAIRLGAERVLILGAGYDSRAYRLATELGTRPVYEVDLPPLSRRKAKIVAAHPELFGHTSITRVEIDFRTQSLAERLADAGVTAGPRTFVAWEGVTPYLSEDAVHATMATLRDVCSPGSRLALDAWRGPTEPGSLLDHVRGAATHAFAAIGEPLTFGLPPTEFRAMLARFGFQVLDQVGGAELAARYATDGRSCEESAYVQMAERG